MIFSVYFLCLSPSPPIFSDPGFVLFFASCLISFGGDRRNKEAMEQGVKQSEIAPNTTALSHLCRPPQARELRAMH